MKRFIVLIFVFFVFITISYAQKGLSVSEIRYFPRIIKPISKSNFTGETNDSIIFSIQKNTNLPIKENEDYISLLESTISDNPNYLSILGNYNISYKDLTQIYLIGQNYYSDGLFIKIRQSDGQKINTNKLWEYLDEKKKDIEVQIIQDGLEIINDSIKWDFDRTINYNSYIRLEINKIKSIKNAYLILAFHKKDGDLFKIVLKHVSKEGLSYFQEPLFDLPLLTYTNVSELVRDKKTEWFGLIPVTTFNLKCIRYYPKYERFSYIVSAFAAYDILTLLTSRGETVTSDFLLKTANSICIGPLIGIETKIGNFYIGYGVKPSLFNNTLGEMEWRFDHGIVIAGSIFEILDKIVIKK